MSAIMEEVYKSHFHQLRREKAAREKRDISIDTVARETGISLRTLKGIAKNPPDYVTTRTLEPLCNYFGVQLSAVLELVPDATTETGKEEG